MEGGCETEKERGDREKGVEEDGKQEWERGCARAIEHERPRTLRESGEEERVCMWGEGEK